jgi:hypothetical protein
MSGSGCSLDLDELATHFSARVRWRDRMPNFLDTLVVLSRIRLVDDRWVDVSAQGAAGWKQWCPVVWFRVISTRNQTTPLLPPTNKKTLRKREATRNLFLKRVGEEGHPRVAVTRKTAQVGQGRFLWVTEGGGLRTPSTVQGETSGRFCKARPLTEPVRCQALQVVVLTEGVTTTWSKP